MQKNELAIERGKRIKTALALLGSTSIQFSQQYNVSERTLRGWAAGWEMLTPKGAKKLSEAFKKAGLAITETWLLAEEHLDLFTTVSKNGENDNSKILSETIKRPVPPEIVLPPTQTIISIDTDKFEPFYKKGGFVATVLKQPTNLEDYMQQVCVCLRGTHYALEFLSNKTEDVHSINMIGKVILYWAPST